MTNHTPTTDEGPAGFETPVAQELEALEKSLTEDISQRVSLKGYLKRLTGAVGKQDAVSLSKLLSDAKLTKLMNIYPQAKPAVDLLTARVGYLREAGIKNIESRLREYCDAQHLQLQGGPRKFVVEHFIAVEFGSAAKEGLKIGNATVKVVAWDNVKNTLDKERQRIWERPFNPKQFKTDVLRAYTKIAQAKKNPTGWVRLYDVYQDLKSERFKEQKASGQKPRLVPYYKDEFGADISRLLEQEGNASGRRSFELSAIRDSRYAFKIIMPGGNAGRFGFLRPAKDST